MQPGSTQQSGINRCGNESRVTGACGYLVPPVALNPPLKGNSSSGMTFFFLQSTFIHVASHPPSRFCRAGFSVPISQVRKPRSNISVILAQGSSATKGSSRTLSSQLWLSAESTLKFPAQYSSPYPGLSWNVKNNPSSQVAKEYLFLSKRAMCWKKGRGKKEMSFILL